jgi:SAM-dependent methyltransferase
VRAFEAVAAFRELADVSAAPRVLDLGAAEGLTLLEMRRLLGSGGGYVGVELSGSLIAEAPPLPGDTKLVKADVCELPDDLGRDYDLVTALAVLEHLPDPKACVRQAYGMLRAGGVIVTTCPNPFWDDLAGTLKLVADEHHEQHMGSARMVGMLREAGFDAVRYRPFMWAPVGVLPYLKVPVPLRLANRIDAIVQSLPMARLTFVNQIAYARKPLDP